MKRAPRSARSQVLVRWSVRVPILVWTLLMLPLTVAAQTADSGDLARDFDVLVQLIEKTHPDPYPAFGGAGGFARTAERFRQEAANVATVEELHALAQRFLARLSDGHTTMMRLSDRSGMPGDWSPLRLAVATDALYVQAAAPQLREYLGSRILAINGLPVAAVLDSVRIRYPSENVYGAMDRLRRLLVRRRPGWPPILKREQPLRVTLHTPPGDTVELAVPFTDERPDLGARQRSLDLGGDNGLLYGKLLEHAGRRVGYFFWSSMVSREVAERWYSRGSNVAGINWAFRYLPGVQRTGDPEKDLAAIPSLYDRFSRLLEEMRSAGAEYLIIDLRRNSGGMTPLVYALLYMLYGDALLESELEAEYDTRLSQLYLSKIGFADIDELNARRGTDFATGDLQDGYLFKNDLAKPIEERRQSSRLTDYGAEYFRPRNDSPPYTPRVVVVTSAATFSAAFHFTYFLAEIGDATVVGVPPRQAPNAFMENTSFTLPHSGLEGSIANSVQVLYPADHPRAKVFTPDFAMAWDDFRRYGFDPDAEILFALDLIRTGRIPGEPTRP